MLLRRLKFVSAEFLAPIESGRLRGIRGGIKESYSEKWLTTRGVRARRLVGENSKIKRMRP